MTLSSKEIEALRLAGESDRVEFKESLGGRTPEAIRETICAFANDLPDNRQPGILLIGLNDNGEPNGLTVTDEMLRTLADMKTDGNIVPLPSMTVARGQLGTADIAVLTVQPSDSPPVRYKGTVFVRTASRRGRATAQDERILSEKRRYRDTPFDVQPVPSARLSDLNDHVFRGEYLPSAIDPSVLSENRRTVEEQLAATKMIASPDDATPTVLGLLVVGRRTQDFLPGAYVQFLRISGDTLSDPIVDDEQIGGTVTEILRRTQDKLVSHNRSSVDIVSGVVEQRSESYPIGALRQIIANAVMHRSYEDNNAPARVHWYNDRIEVHSPGGVYGTVTPENFGQEGLTSYRNPNLAEALKNLGYVQRFGVGIPIARQLLQDAGHPELEFRADMNNVLATVRQWPGGSIK